MDKRTRLTVAVGVQLLEIAIYQKSNVWVAVGEYKGETIVATDLARQLPLGIGRTQRGTWGMLALPEVESERDEWKTALMDCRNMACCLPALRRIRS